MGVAAPSTAASCACRCGAPNTRVSSSCLPCMQRWQSSPFTGDRVCIIITGPRCSLGAQFFWALVCALDMVNSLQWPARLVVNSVVFTNV